ncbi:MAG: preprotein translocase subunit SecE [Phycisphaerales bacterium]
MSFGMYKQDQGYWTRIMTAIGGGLLIVSGAAWLAGEVETINWGGIDVNYAQGVAAGAVLFIGAVALYYLVYVKRNTSDFLIATEGEMRKVNWSTRREVLGSTWVVIGISVIIAAILFVVDLAFASFFREIGVLHTG